MKKPDSYNIQHLYGTNQSLEKYDYFRLNSIANYLLLKAVCLLLFGDEMMNLVNGSMRVVFYALSACNPDL